MCAYLWHDGCNLVFRLLQLVWKFRLQVCNECAIMQHQRDGDCLARVRNADDNTDIGFISHKYKRYTHCAYLYNSVEMQIGF
jgi:hypothetical protein